MNDEVPDIWLIPGLGADGRLFMEFEKNGLKFNVLEFIKPKKEESLKEYALRLSEPIDTSRPFIIGGVSLGGIMAVEIACHKKPEQLFLISTIKHSGEMPFYFKLGRLFPVHHLFSGEFYKKHAPRENRNKMDPQHAEVLEKMRNDADPEFVKWAVKAVVKWKNRVKHDNVIHIHGTRDSMFPGILLGPRNKIKKGTHVMVLTHAEEVLQTWQEALKTL